MKIQNINLKRIKKIVKIKLIALGLAGVTLISSGCAINIRQNNKNNNNNNNTNYASDYKEDNTNSQEESIVETINIDKNIPLETISNDLNYPISITMAEKNYNNFINSLEKNETYYKYSDLYLFDENLNEYNKLKMHKNHNLKLKKLDSNELYEIVKDNNKKYCEKKYSMQKNNIEDKELKNICNVIIEVCNDFVKENPMILEERLRCVLSDLKIFYRATYNNAYVTDDNCLILSSVMIEITNINYGDNTERKTLVHEIVHLLQKGCNCDQFDNDFIHNFGFSYNFKRTNDTSLDFTWLYEASAEKNMCNYLNTEPMTYKNMIGYLESLSFVNLVKDDYKVNDTEKLSFYHNLDALFKFFDAETDEEKNEILKLMYSIEIMQQSPSSFKRLYTAKYNVEFDDKLTDSINYELKSPICKTLTKLFYKNLASTIKNKNIELNDIFYLISVFECDINNHILYNREDRYNYNINFINDYLEIQNEFFYTLSMSNNIEQKEIENSFKNYTSKSKNEFGKTINNYNLSWLDPSKEKYIDERLEVLKNKKTYSIVNTSEYYQNKNKTYKIQK